MVSAWRKALLDQVEMQLRVAIPLVDFFWNA